MKYKTVKTKKDIENDPRVRELHKEFGFAGEDKYGWWCYLNDGWLASNNSQTINEATLKDVCDEINNLESVFLLYDVVVSEERTELVCDCQDPANGYKSMTCKIHNDEELWIGEQTN